MNNISVHIDYTAINKSRKFIYFVNEMTEMTGFTNFETYKTELFTFNQACQVITAFRQLGIKVD